ncbi:hypothetical protein FOL46_008107 [Perkinsus olseni]|uniref:DNA mismatch repair proteins mutS family domain-containing protein n=1 Tax=Perkinsus olseni TaxID=32597 RepID=A0A7J6MMY4_PEROL|nr:hypothetical protein FOL46_008107 [Perkinsus olseni]
MLDSYFHSERPRRRQEWYRSTLEWLEGLVRLEAAAEASSEGRSALSRSRAILICIPAIVYVLDYLKGVIEAGGEVSFGIVKAVLSRVTDEELRGSMELREMVEVMDEIVHPPVSSKEIVNYVLQARPGLVNGWIPRVSTILKHPTLRARLELEAAEAAAAAAKLKKEEEERKKNQGPSVLITELWEWELAEQGGSMSWWRELVQLSMLCGGSGGLHFLSRHRLGPVATGVSEACRRWLQRLHRPAALQLVPMLSLESNELGFLSPSRRAAGGGSLLDFTLDGKRRRPEWIQLVRCGDFYETYGVDAVMLVNYCGLNAMAGRPRAGCRKDQIQMVLDSLTERGFSAAVYEEANESDFNKGPERKRKGKQRYLSQLVSPANPTYVGGGMVAQNTLADGEDISFREDERLAAPRLALYKEPESEDGHLETYTVVQVRVEAREYSLHPCLTPEGVMGLLAAASGWYRATALPLVVSSDIGLPPAWLPVEAAEGQPTPAFAVSLDPVECPMLDGVGGFIDAVLRKVSEEAFCLSLASEGDKVIDEFRAVERTTKGPPGLSPPYTDAINCVGITFGGRSAGGSDGPLGGRGSEGGVPDLVYSLLPPAAPAHTLRFARRWLLRPPSGAYVDDMRHLLSFLRTMRSPLPQLRPTNVPKMVQYLQTGNANIALLKDIHDCSRSVVASYDTLTAESPEVTEALCRIVAAESGCDVGRMRQQCDAAAEAIERVLVFGSDKVNGDDHYPLPEAFTQRNESGFIGSVKGDWSEVVAAREALLEAMTREWPAASEAAVVYESSCNTVGLRRRPREGRSAAFYHPTVGRGRARGEGTSKYWTTKGVEAAAVRYITACDSAGSKARRMLRELCAELTTLLEGLIAASHWCVVLTFAYLHTENALRRGWAMAHLVEGDKVELGVKGLMPYWMDSPPRGTARVNDFCLGQGSPLALITGCNESGKSTFLRSICALALTSNTGLFSPCAEGTAISRLTDVLVMFPRGDRPSDQLSAHALECATLKVVDRDASRPGAKALVVVDEFGRATSPVDGAALTGSQLERFVSAGIACLWATHLQADVLRVLSPAVVKSIDSWRMRVEEDSLSGDSSHPSRKVTYKIEPGVCSNSMGIYTASQTGLPASMVSRAMQLRRLLADERTVEQLLGLPEKPAEVDLGQALLAVSSQDHVDTLLHLSPDSMPPPVYQASSVVYILALSTCDDEAVREYYVGETENLSQRLEQHRRRFEGSHVISAIDCILARGKGEAQSIEAALIRHLQSSGARLVSTHDGAHRGTAAVRLNGDV